MKTFVVCLAIFILQFSQGITPFAIQMVDDFGEKSRTCEVGLQAFFPEDAQQPYQCKDVHEVYACGFSELRCDGRIFCGSSPCTNWKCWCMPPFKRNAEGNCVLWCPREEVAEPKALEAPKAVEVPKIEETLTPPVEAAKAKKV